MKKKKKIGIVGAAITPDDLKKYNKGWELWGVNNLYKKFGGIEFSAWFELHDIGCKHNIYSRRGRTMEYFGGQSINEYMRELDALEIPVYMQREWKRIRKSTAYPLKKVCKKLNNAGYYGCSFAFMAGLAILKGADEIGFFGTSLSMHEYYYQRASTEYIIGIAQGKGIKIRIDSNTDLLKANYIYAFGENHDLIYYLHGRMAMDVTQTIVTAIQQKLDDFTYNILRPRHETNPV